MKKTVRKVSENFTATEEIRKTAFLIIAAFLLADGLFWFVFTLAGKWNIPVIILSLMTMAAPLIAAGISKRSPRKANGLLVYFMVIFLIPSNLFISWTEILNITLFCIEYLMVCCLCSGRSMRFRILIFSVVLNVTVYYVFGLYLDELAGMGLRLVDNNIFIAEILVSIFFYILGTIFIEAYITNNNIYFILRNHMDGKIRKMLLEREGEEKSGEICYAAVMFADISNFTSITDTMDAGTLTDFLNTFFEICDKCIHDNDGIIDKYIGDCVMAFWKFSPEGDEAVKACRAADAIRTLLKEKNEEINEIFHCDMNFSAGINCGPVLMGDVGSENRKDFTIIGDTVNVTARLQDIAPMGKIYLSAPMAELVKDKVRMVRIPQKVPIRGKCEPVEIFNLVSTELPENPDIEMNKGSTAGYLFHICGARGSYSPAGQRFSEFGPETSCYLFKKDDYALIIDCGTGLQRAKGLIEDCTEIDIMLTHLHYDHIVGLMDWSVFPENAKLRFFGTFDKWKGDESLSGIFFHPYWPVTLFRGEMVSVERFKQFSVREKINAKYFPSTHPDEANVILIDLEGKKIAVMSDCERADDIPLRLIKNCDVIIYDGMYEDEYYYEHIGWGHSTWEEGVRLAKKAEPGRLFISHHNPRNSDEKLRGLEIKAKEEYPCTSFARAGDRFVL